MAVTLNKANLVLKDANGNIGKIEQLSDRDLTKIRTAVSDVALVVNQSNHKPIEATTTNKGVVQLATSDDVVSGASDKVVTADQLHNATIGITPGIATSTTLGVVKPDNNTITIDSNGVLTAIKASQDKNGAQIDTTYFKSANGTFTGPEYFRDVTNSVLRFNGGNTHDGGAALMLFGKDAESTPGAFDLAACSKDDASDAKQLIGTPAGSLTWNGINIVRSMNSVYADDNGNVSITSVNHATNADSATNDSSNRNIVNTYATKVENASNLASAKEYTDQVKANYLPLAGGTVTGNVVINGALTMPNGMIHTNNPSTSMYLMNRDLNSGAWLYLGGKDASNDIGYFVLTSNDGKKSFNLSGTPTGVLSWGGLNIVRSVNSVNADDNGNVSITSVNHAISSDSATKAIQDGNGAQIDTTYFKSANGTFTGPEYSRDVTNSVLRFNGGNTHDGGAALMLFGKDAENAQGVFDLAACSKEDASDSKQLIGTPSGLLTWAGHEVERVELKNGNYIRFTSGLTFMWGALEIPAGTKKYTVNLPIPFKSSYQAFLSNLGSDRVSSISTLSYRVDKTSLSAFNIEHTFGGLTGWSYFAVGY